MNTPTSESPSFFSQLGPILFLTTIFFLNFIGRIVFAPLMPSIENDLGLDHTEAGSIFLLISLGYFISLLGSGFVSSVCLQPPYPQENHYCFCPVRWDSPYLYLLQQQPLVSPAEFALPRIGGRHLSPIRHYHPYFPDQC